MKDKIKKTAEHIGIISIGALETLVREVREETIREVEDSLPKSWRDYAKITEQSLTEDERSFCDGYNQCINDFQDILNKLK